MTQQHNQVSIFNGGAMPDICAILVMLTSKLKVELYFMQLTFHCNPLFLWLLVMADI